jgi:hypothetical protein
VCIRTRKEAIRNALLMSYPLTIASLTLCLLLTACGKKSVDIDDARYPKTLTLRSSEDVKGIELEVQGLLSGHARLLLVKPSEPNQIWQGFELMPIVVAGMPRGIAPVSLNSEYNERELIIKYEPGRKVSGHLNIVYRFKSR